MRIENLRRKWPSALLAGLLLCALPVWAVSAEGQVHYGRAAPLGSDKSLAATSPFRLSINRSDYRMVSSKVAPIRKSKKSNNKFSPIIERQARAKGLDPDLVHAVIRAESAYRPDVVSPKGAVGLMQVMPDTGKRFGVSELDHPENNLRAGTAYLRYLLNRFNNVPLALAAYNAGEGAVARHGNQIPPYPETRGYVQSILRDYADASPLGTPLPQVYAEGLRLAENDQSPYRLVRVPLR